MKRLSFILTLPITLVVLVFALANRGPIALSLWPFDLRIDMPIYLAVLGSVAVGFLLGGLVAWIAGRKSRSRVRRLQQETQRQASEIAELKKRHAATASTAAPASGTALVATSARTPVPTP